MSIRKSAQNVVSVAKQRAHRPDYQLLLFMGLLMLLGLIIMYAIGPQRAQVLNAAAGKDTYGPTYFVIKQFTSLLFAGIAFAAAVFVPLEVIKRYAAKFLIAGLVASAILFVFGNLLHVNAIAQCSLGACRWINLGPLGTFQPSELLKLGILVFGARFLSAQIRAGKVNDWQESLGPFLAVTGLLLLIVVVIQKDLGTGIALGAIALTMLFIAGINRQTGLKLGIGILILGTLAIVAEPHRLERISTFFQGDSTDSTQAALDENYQIRHAKIAIGTGGLLGVGIGNSVEATGYLPEAINDSLFAILGETFGFIGLVVIIALFTGLLLRIVRIGDRLSDPWLRLLAVGVFGWVAAHVVLNIASMIGVFPLTGITLPLLSFGGTSMLFIAAGLGIVFQASRYTSHRSTIMEAAYANTSSGRGLGRTRDAGRRRTQ